MTSWRSGNSVTHRCRFVGTAGGLSSAPGRQQLCVQCLLSSQQVLGAGLWLVPFGLVIVPTPRLHSSRWLWGQFWGVHSCVWGGGLCLQNSREASVSMPLCSAEPILWSLVLLVGNVTRESITKPKLKWRETAGFSVVVAEILFLQSYLYRLCSYKHISRALPRVLGRTHAFEESKA